MKLWIGENVRKGNPLLLILCSINILAIGLLLTVGERIPPGIRGVNRVAEASVQIRVG